MIKFDLLPVLLKILIIERKNGKTSKFLLDAANNSVHNNIGIV